MNNSIEAYRTKLYQLIFGISVFFIGIQVVRRSVASGNSNNIYTVAVITVVSALILLLDKYYWTLGCFLIFLVDVPRMRVSGLELGSAILVCMYFIRSILRREAIAQNGFPVFVVLLPYLFWVGLCFALNPCGLYIFGSENIGFRFYVMLVIGLAALFVLSRMSFSEKQAHVFFWVVIAGSLSYLVLNAKVFRSVVSGDAFHDALHYEFIQMRVIAMLILCRYSLAEILTKLRLLFCFGMASFLCMYSGNRTVAMTPPICMASLVFVRKRERGLFVVLAMFGLIVSLLLALGHGHFYRLPQGFQKAMSFLPGDWDAQWRNYGFKDSFRADLRERARQTIKANPWTGRKGFSISLEELAWLRSSHQLMEGHQTSGNWHNLWLGLAADFGIPCMVFFALFYFISLFHVYRKLLIFRHGSWAETMYLFMFMRLLMVFFTSLAAGGHSAKTPEETFLWLGFCLALINGREAELRNQNNLIRKVLANRKEGH